jgi:predicted RNA-binding protein with PIN domain
VPILIDGHNLIGRIDMLSLQDPDDEARLVRLLVSYGARAGKRVTVVFDPGSSFQIAEKRRLGGVEVVFASHGSSADAVILRRVRHSRNPAEWQVVTSDERLANEVRRSGARVSSAEAFAAQMQALQPTLPDRKEIPPSPQEIEDWLHLFQKST